MVKFKFLKCTILFILFFGLSLNAQKINWDNTPLNPTTIYYSKNHFNLNGPVKEIRETSFGGKLFNLDFNKDGYLTKKLTSSAGGSFKIVTYYTYLTTGVLSSTKQVYLDTKGNPSGKSLDYNYAYNQKGLIASKTQVSKGEKTIYNYDSNNNLISISYINSNGNPVKINEYSYNNYGQIILEKEHNNYNKRVYSYKFKYHKKDKNTLKIVHWIGDFFDDRLTKTSAITDQYYFTDSGLLEDAKAMGLTQSSYLPLAFNPDLFKLPEQEARINDLLFIGAWSKNREDLIRKVEQPMTVVGKGWDRIQDTHHNVIGKNVSNKQVAGLYQQHACVLNIINSGNIKNGLNMRCFEAPACGALLITDNVIDLPNCYESGLEVLTYETPESLAAIYKTLLDDVDRLKRIANAGHTKATNSHAYKSRIETILNETGVA